MCGIAGYFGGGSDTLAHMANALSHRGPDDADEWFSSDRIAGFAHRRLAIIDLSQAGHQPMIRPSTNLVIVFNGEIYNFQELRSELEAGGVIFRGHSDTEVLLALYKVHGEALLSMLNGIFAFAIFNQAERTMFIACDAMGVKPLYFSEGRDGFVF